MIFASEQEAADFASLPAEVQSDIKTTFLSCLQDVETFSLEEPDEALRELELQEGISDCTETRGAQIRSAIAQEKINQTTQEITSE